MERKKAALLVRCSTDQQDYQRQIEDLTALAEEWNYSVSEDLIYGEYVTGRDDVTKEDRDSIKRLRKAINKVPKPDMDVLFISEVSRLSRDSLSGRFYVRELNNAKIPTYFKDKRRWTMNPDTKVIDHGFIKELGTYFDGAAEYLQSLKYQTHSGRKSKLKENQLVVGHVPLGYKKKGGNDKHTKGTIVVDPDTAPIVEDMFNLYAQKDASLKKVAIQISAKYKRKFSVSAVQQTISRDLYATGKYIVEMRDPNEADDSNKTNGHLESFTVEFERPLISMELFETVTKLRSDRKTVRAPYPTQQVHLLSKLIICPSCGRAFSPCLRSGEKLGERYRLTNGKPTYEWRCMARINNSKECDCHINLNNEKVEILIWDFIKKVLIGMAELGKEQRIEKVEIAKEEIAKYKREIKAYKAEIDSANRKEERAYNLYLEEKEERAEISKKFYNKTCIECEKKRNYAQSVIDSLSNEIESNQRIINFLSRPIKPLEFASDIENNEEEKRSLFVELIKRITPYRVDYRIVVFEVATIDGIYYIMYNGNQRKNIVGYYVSEVWAHWQNTPNRIELYDSGNYFVIKNANLIMDTEDLECAADFYEMQDIAAQNGWILNIDYESPKSTPIEEEINDQDNIPDSPVNVGEVIKFKSEKTLKKRISAAKAEKESATQS